MTTAAKEASAKLEIGFVGLGNMGYRMALNIARAGHSLSVYNRTSAKAIALRDAIGAAVCASPAELAAQSDVVITMVSDDVASRELYFGAGGLAQTLQPGSTCIEMGTVAPEFIFQLKEKLAPRGIHLLDSPVSGSVAMAEEGRLTIMVGGSGQDLSRVLPVLQCMAQQIIHVGPLGTGAAMKLVVNAVIFGLNQALAEALVLAEAAGIDRRVAYDVLQSSAAAAPYVHYRKQSFLDPGTVSVAFSLDLARKDLDLIGAFASQFHAPMPQTNLNRQVINEALQAGRGNDDVSAIAEHLRAIH